MAKKKKNNRAVLVTSCVLAALIVAGSTFAWFTSKDEVTNRLTATSEYGVAIAETFHAPESWVPGQEINKDAAAVNTGNVDAFVRMWLTGSMRLLQQTTSGTSVASIGTPTNVTDSNLLNMGMTFPEILRRVTQVPARQIGIHPDGFLLVGEAADIAIFRQEDKEIHFKDRYGNEMDGHTMLRPMMTIKNGAVLYRQNGF